MKMTTGMMMAALALGSCMVAEGAAQMPSAVTAMPGQISYQGLLQEPTKGTPYASGLYTIDFRLYTQQSGGTPIWGGSYQAYVKDGYFSVMLGDSASKLSGCTYGPADLWKAMWLTGSGSNKALYLGVTPRQDSTGSTLAGTPAEISPRQRLLAAPFALRAERATYADKASGDFSVSGKLTVSGEIEAKSQKLTLSHISSDEKSVSLGTATDSPATTTVQGGAVYVNAKNNVNVNPGNQFRVNVPSNGGFYLSGGSNSGLWSDGLELNAEGPKSGKLDVYANKVWLHANSVDGTGPVRWKSATSGAYLSPMAFKIVTLNFPRGTRTLKVSLKSSVKVDIDNYQWSVGGVHSGLETISLTSFFCDACWLYVRLLNPVAEDTTVNVFLFGHHRQMLDSLPSTTISVVP